MIFSLLLVIGEINHTHSLKILNIQKAGNIYVCDDPKFSHL